MVQTSEKAQWRQHFSELSFAPTVQQHFHLLQFLQKLLKQKKGVWGLYHRINNKLFSQEPDIELLPSAVLQNTYVFPKMEDQQMVYVDSSGKQILPEFVLVPGMAFDEYGVRLGRGQGHFDRFFSENKMFKVGVCFDAFFLKQLPCFAHDVKMDLIVTNAGMHKVRD